jgi:hypothetical protein
MAGPGRTRIPSLSFTHPRSKVNTVKWSHPLEVGQPFLMEIFYQAFNNIVPTSEWDEHFNANPASGNCSIDHIRSALC